MLPKPIIFTLEVDKIEFNADYGILGDNNEKIKLFKADIRDFKYEYLRKKDLNSQMNIKFGKTDVTGYRYEQQKDSKEKSFIIH